MVGYICWLETAGATGGLLRGKTARQAKRSTLQQYRGCQEFSECAGCISTYSGEQRNEIVCSSTQNSRNVACCTAHPTFDVYHWRRSALPWFRPPKSLQYLYVRNISADFLFHQRQRHNECTQVTR